jgi:DNA-binding CsgD family transcriptional regulator
MRVSNQVTNRQLDILALHASGNTAPEIAKIEFVSLHTVRSHLKTTKRLMRAKTLTQCVAVAVNAGRLEVREDGSVQRSRSMNE